MKRIVAIGFLVVLTLQLVGFYAYFSSRLLAIRREMRTALATLPETRLENLSISADEFKKIDFEKNEINLSGKMYDIAKIVRQGDGYVLFVLHDTHEDSLLSLLHEMVKRSSDDKKPVPSQLVQLLSLVFLPVQMNFMSSYTHKHFLITEYINTYQSVVLSIQAPPPWA